MNEKYKEFKPTSWSIDNKTTIYLLAVIIAVFGLISYNSIPKEQFPEIVIPTIIVNTIYPGTAPTDIENLITRPIEKNIKSINGVKKITSSSVQDFGAIVVEFNPDVDVTDAKQKVKDAVDKSKNNLPSDLKTDPSVMEISFSEFPIMQINISGDYDLDRLKKYAEEAQDKIESVKQITRVDIIGALSREIQVNCDMYKMQAANCTFGDIERAVAYENMTISGGTIDVKGMTRSIRIIGEFDNVDAIRNITFKTSGGAIVVLKDIAEVVDSFKDQESYARLDGKNVITMNVIKKSGENLLDAAEQINTILDDLKEHKYPKDLNIVVTGDQSSFTKTTLADLNNTIIIGFILVTIILMFFMGLTNAFFVGLSVPLSMALAYIVMPGIDFTMNMLVMFAFIFALGIVVDDAIVVIENTHRVFKQNKGKLNITKSAKFAAGEVFLPILSGTLTTLAPFFPLAFWPGIVGKFMYFIPVTLILTLFASLIVAYIINPVFAVSFMKHNEDEEAPKKKIIVRNSIIMLLIAGIFHILSWRWFGNFTIFFAISYILHNIWGYKAILWFQHRVIPALLNKYEKLLRWTLEGRRPVWLLSGMVVLFFATLILTGIAKPKVVFFPENEPKTIIVFAKFPIGTSVNHTDSVTKIIETKINEAIGEDKKYVESIVANVALGAAENQFDNFTQTSNRSKITINFVDFAKRGNISTTAYLDKIREALKTVAGPVISVDKNVMGPPTGKPINIELTSENLEELSATSQRLIKYLDSLNIAGIEELKSDFVKAKPEIVIDIDRTRANREGVSTAQIGMEIRTAIFGKEITKYREGEDQFPVQVRVEKQTRDNIDKILNSKITYRDMNTGMLRSIPISAVAKIEYSNTYGGITRKNLKRVITVSSNILTGYTANEVVQKIESEIPKFQKAESIDIKMTGEKEDQAESGAFLGKAMLLSLGLILVILVTQFKSFTKTGIILSQIVFSIIGVLIGYIVFGMSISIIMTGLGIVALAGIVVRNGILLVEFTDVLRERGMKTREAIIQGGKTRITPVILTASATIIGLVPLAIGFNIDFITLFTELNPHIHFGGDSAMFFGALAWTIIFGLTFATFLTLILVPAMYYLMYVSKTKMSRGKSNRQFRRENRR